MFSLYTHNSNQHTHSKRKTNIHKHIVTFLVNNMVIMTKEIDNLHRISVNISTHIIVLCKNNM